MKSKYNNWMCFLAAFAFIVILFFSNSVFVGAQKGLELCLYTVIPALFPFIFISSLLNQQWSGRRFPILRSLGKICRIPDGCESLLLIGLLGGYPVGAKVITEAYNQKRIGMSTARRLLGFCNNAGPAFIFGIISQQFINKRIPIIIWSIHVLSAILVGYLLPINKNERIQPSIDNKSKQYDPLRSSISAIGIICSCVILSQVFLSLMEPYVLSRLPLTCQIILTGMIELTSGCILSNHVANEALRFIAVCCLLSCGGVCVAIQTYSISGTLRAGLYLPGKILQVFISFLLSGSICSILFPNATIPGLRLTLIIVLLILFTVIVFKMIYMKKIVAFLYPVVYNNRNNREGL